MTEKMKDDNPDDESISFDFSKVKNFFAKKHKASKKEAHDEEEIEFSFNIDGISQFFVRYGAFFLLLIPILLSVFLRMQSVSMPITDDWSRQTILGNIGDQIATTISQQYPNLPEQNKASLVDKELKLFMEQNKGQLYQQIQEGSAFYKSQFMDDTGNIYLITIDPYYWQRHAENVLEHGHAGDELREGKPYDTYMLAPVGRNVPRDMLYAYVLAYSYKFMNMFSGISLIEAAIYLPVILAALSVIPAFLIVRKFAGNIGGFFAAMMIAMHYGFLTRSMAGISDTDSFNILFPLVITYLFLEAFETEKVIKAVLLSALAGIVVGIYSFGWGGWWYIFDFILIAVGVYLVYYIATSIIMMKKHHAKASMTSFVADKKTWLVLILTAVFFISSMAIVAFFIGMDAFFTFATGPLGFLKLKEVATQSIWPNVYTTVAEQNAASLREVIANIGGPFMFFLSALGIVFTTMSATTSKKEAEGRKEEIWYFAIAAVIILLAILAFQDNLYIFMAALILPLIVKIAMNIFAQRKEVDFKFASLMLIWFLATLFASVKGVRFILLLVPVYSVGLGIFMGIAYDRISEWLINEIKASRKIVKPVMLIALIMLIMAPLTQSYNIARSRTSDMNDAWYNALSKIDREASPDAIITSWWDFGHWFKYIGNRPVTFDGTSQGYDPVHWVGRTLVTSDEKEAVAILRMMDCGNYQGNAELKKYMADDLDRVLTLKKIIMMDKQDAKAYLLNKKLLSQQADDVLQFTHCDPPEDYFVTSEDMVLKSRVWAHFGLWDFKKAAMYMSVKDLEQDAGMKILMEKFGLDESTADQYFYDIRTTPANDWISPWPSYLPRSSPCAMDKENATLYCADSLKVNLTDYSAMFTTNVNRKLKNLMYVKGNEVKEKNVDASGDITVAIVRNGAGYESVLMDPALADSMFTRLFYFNGIGLEHFKLFDHQTSIFGTDIYVWRVDWEGAVQNRTGTIN